MYLKPILEEFETASKYNIDGEEQYYEIFKNPNLKDIKDISYDKQEGQIRGFMKSDGNIFVVSPQEDLIHSTMLKILDGENILDYNQNWYLTYTKTYEKYIGVVLINKSTWYLAESYSVFGGSKGKNKIPDEYLEKYKKHFERQGKTFVAESPY